MGVDQTERTLGAINAMLFDRREIGDSPTVQLINARPTYEIYSLEPWATSGQFGRFINRAPVVNGEVPIVAVVHKPSVRIPGNIFLHLGIEVGDRLYGYPLNMNRANDKALISGLVKLCDPTIS